MGVFPLGHFDFQQEWSHVNQLTRDPWPADKRLIHLLLDLGFPRPHCDPASQGQWNAPTAVSLVASQT